MMDEFDIVFLKPLKFEDCLECVEHINMERIVHINLCELDVEKSQRILDFISGAIYIKEGEILNPGPKIYCSIPKNKIFKLGYKISTKSMINTKYDEEEEIVPKYNQ